MNKNLNCISDIKIAHRGLHNIEKGIPENSLVAFDNAIKNNLAIELDVHLLKDHSLIVFHDDNLKRCCNGDKKVKDLTHDEIKNYTLFDTEHKIPLFEDVLDYVDSKVPLIIEVKNDIPAYKICPYLLEKLKNYKGIVAIKSFNPFVCLWLKKYAPEHIRGLLVSDFNKEKHFKIVKKIFLSTISTFNLCKPDFLSVSKTMLKSKRIKKYHKNGILIMGWTFKSKYDMLKYQSFCDSYIFENINEL